ncbi:uncharacterized protein B0T15DRAFT_138596 [Chaetomium strumarium]|uniref:NmrA-like domain-containing protein n=1 Tax=Chaetomium strumarium TaxID=1170767 RepID=A0AAJ0GUM6_9PEZI|nr:hypothetical protein B0T15DRAFT_138596 [Chaetomium strumarium]
MVKVAIAGPGHLAREIIDALLATGKHEIILLARKDATPDLIVPGTTWVKVDYQDRGALVRALQGVHTVLSFIVVSHDTNNTSQKTLIDAAIEAGVKRIAPSEWALANQAHLETFYANKLEIRKYLEYKNQDKQVIEYTLFQPGWFMNYLAGPRGSTKRTPTSEMTLVDHGRLRAHVVAGAGNLDKPVTYTALHDIANIVAKAVEYEGAWPTNGGINGHTLSLGEEITIGEKIRGKPFQIEALEAEDLTAGIVKASWLPPLGHQQHPGEPSNDEFAKAVLRAMLLNHAAGAAVVSDEWNRIFPDYKFTKVDEFLTGAFGDA